MTILVIGATGQIGSLVVEELTKHGHEVSALTHGRSTRPVPDGVLSVDGDVTDLDFMRGLLPRYTTLFILNPVVPDELTRALLTLDLAAEAGIARVVYFSMINADIFADVPHGSAKFAAERAIERLKLPATILRANYFFQNDLAQKVSLTSLQQYASPIGDVGVTMVDARDIAEIAATELIRRERASNPLPTEILEVVGPETFTGRTMAGLWADVLEKPIRYAGDDLMIFEENTRKHMAGPMAYDMTLMFRSFQRDGMLGAPGAADHIARRLRRPLKTYRAFAVEAAANW